MTNEEWEEDNIGGFEITERMQMWAAIITHTILFLIGFRIGLWLL